MTSVSSTPIYIDLDRTLYQTDQLPAIIEQLARLYPDIDREVFLNECSQYYVESGGQYYHDMSAQLEHYGLEPTAVYQQLRSSSIADNRLLFPGGEALAGWLKQRGNVSILTYGADDYQRAKAALCPALDDLPIITLREDKAAWLRREVGEKRALMIDDKPIGSELPENIAFVQVSLEGKARQSGSHWPVLGSLGAVLEMLTAVEK